MLTFDMFQGSKDIPPFQALFLLWPEAQSGFHGWMGPAGNLQQCLSRTEDYDDHGNYT